MKITGSNVLVTGSSRGLGRAMAVEFARAGAANIIINHLGDQPNAQAAASEVKRFGAKVAIIEADVADPEAVRGMAEQTHQFLGGVLQVLVNNAGIITRPGGWAEQSDADLQRTLMVDLAGAMHCVRAFAPDMEAAGGCIINIASDNGIAGTAAIASYSAAKAGLIQYTRNMAVELAPKTRVNAIAPGVCDTDMTHDAGDEVLRACIAATPLGRIGKPEEIAHAAIFLAENEFMTGAILSVDGGITLHK